MRLSSLVLLLAGYALVATALSGADGPSIAPPAGAISVVRDTAANYWALSPVTDGKRSLLVLRANGDGAWEPAPIGDLEPGDWQSILPQSDRTVLITSPHEIRRFDSRTPERGASLEPANTPRTETVPPPWRLVSRMPSSNHDLSAAVVDGKYYIAGGMTWDWGLAARNHYFDEMWVLDPKTWAWSVATKFSQPRVYCSTAAFEGKVWIVGGDVIDPGNQRRTVTRVEIFDPRTGQLSAGPELPDAIPAPLTLAAGGRLWVVGSRNREDRGQMASIGPGETAWRKEPEALPDMWALAGAALDDKIYVCVPNTGLCVFDPATKKWTVIPGTKARSAQGAAWRGEIWIMGGADIADWSETQIYNPSNRTWRMGPSLPAKIAWGAAGVVDDQLVVTGGATPRVEPGGRTYDFSDRTFVLAAAAIPPAVTVTEGRPLPRWSDTKLRGTGDTGLPFTTAPVFTQFKLKRLSIARPIPLRSPNDKGRWLIAEAEGSVWTVPDKPISNQPDPFLDLFSRYHEPILNLAITFHPKFPAVPHAYVLYNHRPPGTASGEDVLARYNVVLTDPPHLDMDSEQVLLRWPSRGHDGGDIKFGPDGYMYVSVGDRSAPGDPNNLTQRLDMITGAMLRLDIEHQDPGKNYAVPKDNPWVGRSDVLPEFWAYGLRNPWRMNFDPSGAIWVGDNGDDSWETLRLVRKGSNHGWSVFEGTHPFKRNRELAGPTPTLTPPIIELPHSEARSFIGGFVYRGKANPSLVGDYVWGDYVTGFMWAFKWDGSKPQNFRRIADTRGQTISFDEDRDREIVMARNDGTVLRLVAAPPPVAAKNPFPAKLSETGVFASTGKFTPAPGVVPYEVNATMWSDGMQVHRHLAVSDWQNFALGEGDTSWNVPDGTTIARTLELPASPGPRRVETQLMYRENGTWRFYSYAWNDAQTDAELVKAEGDTRPLTGVPNRKWRFMGRGECTICHTTQTNFTIGLNTAQLNRDADFTPLGRRVENQILALADAGMIKPTASVPPDMLPRKVNPADVSATLEARARAYLDVNCAHCHRKDGVGGRPGIQFLDTLTLDKTGAVNARPLVPLLGTESKVIAPGHPEQSEVYHRITLPTGGRMPLLGSDLVDKAGTELIKQWILSLPPVPEPSPRR